MSMNPNTKTYWRRVSRLARKLAFDLSYTTNAVELFDLIQRVDPKATRAMHREAVKMAIEECDNHKRAFQSMAERTTVARAALQEFQKLISLRVIEGGRQ